MFIVIRFSLLSEILKKIFPPFTESPKDPDNSTISEENVRLNSRADSILEPPSRSSSPTESTSRHMHHYRTLQSYSSTSNKLNMTTITTTTTTTNTITTTTTSYRRDIDRGHSKRWHTAPKEKSVALQHNNASSINKVIYHCTYKIVNI